MSLDDANPLLSAAQRIRAAGGLGRSPALHRLFDYLIDCTLSGKTPRETDLAADVFDKPGTDLLVDASVRVYVHRLRRKLEDYYEGPGQREAERLVLPKGEYRFQLRSEPLAEEPDEDELLPVAAATPGRHRRWLFLLAGLILGAAFAFGLTRMLAPGDGLEPVRASKVWAPIMASRRPLVIVSGDYYIIGEKEQPDWEPSRLVREFAINSRGDLDEAMMRDPELQKRYVDLNLYYLPVSAGYALKTVLPIVAPGLGNRRTTWFIPSSRLATNMLKDNEIIYAGLLSGLGLLQEPVFTNSRFAIGGSYDEIIDGKTGKTYVADPPRDGETARRNYAYIARLPGPNGNDLFIIAGTRDAALMQAADLLSSPDSLEQLAEKAGNASYFEALYAVDGVGEGNLRGTLIAVAPRKADGMWDAMVQSGQDSPGKE